MTTKEDLKTWISQSLNAVGLSGRGSIWRLKGPEVQWVVHIDELPYGTRLGVDIGLDLQIATVPQRPTNCPIVIHLENLPAAKDFAVVASLDVESGLAPESRREILDNIARALGDYLAGHLTLESVRAAYTAGDFASAFIRKDARTTLEAGGPRGI